MKILLLGSGGREHALAWKLRQSPLCEALYLAPGSDAMAELGERVKIDANDPAAVVQAAKEKGVGLIFVGPEAPLAAGVADAAQAAGIPCFGPKRQGAQLEASKEFSKAFMLRHGVATARAQAFGDRAAALDYARQLGLPVVLKADGLAAGKGVIIPETAEQLESALDEYFVKKVFGEAGARVLVEEFMAGEEASLLCFCDGKRLEPMVAAQDHKRVFDQDQGPNTGGMGAYSPAPVYDEAVAATTRERVLEPTLRGLLAEGLDYRGCLYVGLMITSQGPKVVEYNVRFGDPETQVVVPRMDFDLAEVALACAQGALEGALPLRWKAEAAACVVMASGGYPGAFEKGKAISGLEDAARVEGALVFHAGTQRQGESYASSGGRVLGVTALGQGFKQAISRAYEAADKIHFQGAHYRRDIGGRALNR